MSLFDTLREIVHDGWINIFTGLGSALSDKRLGASASFSIMVESDAEQLYAGDDVASTIVDSVAEDALRQGITFQCDEVAELDTAIQDNLENLGARNAIFLAWSWARLYGGACIMLNVDDSKDLDEPLDLNAIRKINSLTVLNRHELRVTTSDLDLDMSSARYGKPNYYRFAPRRGGSENSGKLIHHSRMIRFDGVRLPLRLHITNGYWGDSVLNKCQNAIRNFASSNDSAAAILQEFNQGVFTMKGLADLLANGKDDLVQKRIAAAQLGRSVCRAIVIDEGESFTNVGAALSGVPEMLDRVAARLVVAAKMPHDKLLGDSPSGLGATGESENRVWYDFVAAQREEIAVPPMHLLIQLILRSRLGPTKGVEPKKWGFEFKPLWQHDEGEIADIRLKVAQADQIYIAANVLDPDEVATSRFGSGKWSAETTIDMETRPASTGGEGAKPEGGEADPIGATKSTTTAAGAT